MATDPNHVLPMAVEAAQRLASEMVADAVRAADRAGYERGRAEGRRSIDGVAAIIALLRRSEKALGDIEASGASISGHCDDIAIAARRRGKRVDSIDVPSDGDCFGDVEKFISDYGGKSVVDPDDIEIDDDSVRNAATEMGHECTALRNLLEEAILCLTVESEPVVVGVIRIDRPDDSTPAQRAAREGVITQSMADEVDGKKPASSWDHSEGNRG